MSGVLDYSALSDLFLSIYLTSICSSGLRNTSANNNPNFLFGAEELTLTVLIELD